MKIEESPRFYLTEAQTKKYIEWRVSLPRADFGTTGGGYSFIFTPTSLGPIIKVKRDDGFEIDLTEYDSF